MQLQNLQNDFKGTAWKHEIDVRDFIQNNYEPYNGDILYIFYPYFYVTKIKTKEFNPKILNFIPNRLFNQYHSSHITVI